MSVMVLNESWGRRSGKLTVICPHTVWSTPWLLGRSIRVKDRPEAFAYTVNWAMGKWHDEHPGRACGAWVHV